jgi:ribosome-associated heat shock protein Hsp15
MNEAQRIDKWLWFARFLKSRSQASALAASGRLRVNGALVGKAHHQVKAGDVLTFPLGHHIRVIRIIDTGSRRGPAPEAQSLYQDLEPPLPRPPAGSAAGGMAEPPRREAGSGRPTKRERRALDSLMDGEVEEG